jgi:hypothetical protein
VLVWLVLILMLRSWVSRFRIESDCRYNQRQSRYQKSGYESHGRK